MAYTSLTLFAYAKSILQLERERGNPADWTAKGGVETVDGKKGNRGALPAMRCAHS